MMKSEYLLLNVIILSGPMILSFDRRVRYVRNWHWAFAAAVATLIPFIIWDSLVSGRHWWFNQEYTLDFRIMGLPPGEWLFFITVPFACLFIWEIITYFHTGHAIRVIDRLRLVWLLIIPLGVWIALAGKEYTGIVLLVFSLVMLLDKFLKTNITLDGRYYTFLAIQIALMLIFNGYLTARPVVLYDPSYQLNFRIFTIPIEDFIYGISHVTLTIIIYTKMKDCGRG
ncbi:lycopene cyclase domain-containing protein [candidate division KSB1 bacterium]|nr:lycopene cyclase domain-containing protein [candidate division KSB1 bacterium]